MEDDVDAVVGQWRGVRPDLDVSPMEVFVRLTQAGDRIDRRIAGHGVDRQEFDVLAALRRVGAPYQLKPSDLSRSLLAPTGTMTGRLDRLANRGLIERRPNPSDRRGVIVCLTEEGVRVTDALIEVFLDEERRMLAVLDPADRRRLANLLRSLVRAMDAARGESG